MSLSMYPSEHCFLHSSDSTSAASWACFDHPCYHFLSACWNSVISQVFTLKIIQPINMFRVCLDQFNRTLVQLLCCCTSYENTLFVLTKRIKRTKPQFYCGPNYSVTMVMTFFILRCRFNMTKVLGERNT